MIDKKDCEHRFLLIQVRNPNDSAREHEIDCFSRSIGCQKNRIVPHDLLKSCPSQESVDSVDAVLIGGSGDYSVVDAGDWFNDASRFFRHLCESGKPTFASCWGFQAIAKALGGEVVTDLNRAEVGTIELEMTNAGTNDPVFGPLGRKFEVQIGHQDIVEKLPKLTSLLCSSNKVTNQAFVVNGKPIYGTQFHPEMRLNDLVHRLENYPEYVRKITGLTMHEFAKTCSESLETQTLIQRFVQNYLS